MAARSSIFALKRFATYRNARQPCCGAVRPDISLNRAISTRPVSLGRIWSQEREHKPFSSSRSSAEFLCLSPAVVANLWDVTDKDIDRFAQATFAEIGLSGTSATPSTLPGAICKSRKACTLRYLNGAAPVVWGFPVRIAVTA